MLNFEQQKTNFVEANDEAQTVFVDGILEHAGIVSKSEEQLLAQGSPLVEETALARLRVKVCAESALLCNLRNRVFKSVTLSEVNAHLGVTMQSVDKVGGVSLRGGELCCIWGSLCKR